MSDVWSELEERLKQKANSGGFIMVLVAHNHRVENDRKWVRLEDIQSELQQLKQNYDLVSKKFFDYLLDLEKKCDEECRWAQKDVVSVIISVYKELLKD